MHRWALPLVASVALLVLLSSVPLVGALATPVPSAPAPKAAAPVAATIPSIPRPSITCPMGFPTYTSVNGLLPLDPTENNEYPCPMPGHDEIHASLYAAQSGSGGWFNVPIHLPKNHSHYMNKWMYDMYVGVPVTGDARSIGGSSFAEAILVPNATAWSVYVAIWASLNTTKYLSSGGCTGLNFTWNDSYWCEIDDVSSNAPIAQNLTGGSFVNITFVGSSSGTSGLIVYVNGSATNSSGSFRFDSNHTGSYTFEPEFSASCVDSCQLPWAHSFGLGLGVDNCPAVTFSVLAPCDSYNFTRQGDSPPIEFGIPRYWNGSAYGGEYKFLALESTSGACSTSPNTAVCHNFISFGGNGAYPYFTFNGSVLNYGTSWNWTTYTWGGANVEFYGNGGPQDFIPLFITASSDTSQAGYVPSSTGLTVTANLQAYGTITGAVLHYLLPTTTSWATTAMSRLAGTSTDANYSGAIPSSGGDGSILYYLTAADLSGGVVSSSNATVIRGPLPHFVVTVNIVPGWCGTVSLNGSTFTNGTNGSFEPGSYAISASGCRPYSFSSWSTSTPKLGVANGELAVGASGTVTASFHYVRPIDLVTVYLNPSNCGSVTINGTNVATSGTTIQLLDSLNYSIAASGCAGQSFSYWNVSGRMNILGGNFEPQGNGSVGANAVSSTSGVSVIVHTIPGCGAGSLACGGIDLYGVGYIDNQSLTLLPGSYPIKPAPPAHYGFLNWSTSGGVSVANGQLAVTASGSVTEVNYKLTEVTILTYPAWCGQVVLNNVSFTNGGLANVTNHSTDYVYAIPCRGYFFIGWYFPPGGAVAVSGNYVTVDGPGLLEAVFSNKPPAVNVAFLTSPNYCGAVLFQGQIFYNSNFTKVPSGTSGTISALPCVGYGFVAWQTSGGVTIKGNTAYLNGSGSIIAYFHPLVSVFFFTQPANCGAIVVNGIPYANNATALFPQNHPENIAIRACPHYHFAGWFLSTGANVSGFILNLTGPSIIQALFSPDIYSVHVAIPPPGCGTVYLQGVPIQDNGSILLSVGSYPLSSKPCFGYTFLNWTATGNLSLAGASGTNLSVNGPGTLVAHLGPIPPALTLTAPTSTLAGSATVFGATIAVLLPPFTYNYTWAFGDGSTVSTPVNFTTHTYDSAGTYTLHLTVTDPFQRVVEANASVHVVAPSSSSGAIPFTTWVALGLGGIGAILGLSVIVLNRRRRPPVVPVQSSAVALSGPSDAFPAFPADSGPTQP
jgi:PKD domain-containing protein/List-Bact-rpt repeat protein